MRAMADGPLRRLFWRVADDLDYLVTLARRRIMDALAGPEPETPDDQQLARDRERIEKAFPETEREQPNAVISHRTDRVPTEDCLPSWAWDPPRGSHLRGGPYHMRLMDQPADPPPQPAEYYRRKAAEARQTAEGATTRAVKDRLHGLACDFDRLADAADNAEQAADAPPRVIRRR